MGAVVGCMALLAADWAKLWRAEGCSDARNFGPCTALAKCGTRRAVRRIVSQIDTVFRSFSIGSPISRNRSSTGSYSVRNRPSCMAVSGILTTVVRMIIRVLYTVMAFGSPANSIAVKRLPARSLTLLSAIATSMRLPLTRSVSKLKVAVLPSTLSSTAAMSVSSC